MPFFKSLSTTFDNSPESYGLAFPFQKLDKTRPRVDEQSSNTMG
ncbi:MAG: hypothetical protein ACI9TH_000065 [Kiritimatiellia bacterium]|jgi:hypothetical protein